jgi:hypothetical protein
VVGKNERMRVFRGGDVGADTVVMASEGEGEVGVGGETEARRRVRRHGKVLC